MANFTVNIDTTGYSRAVARRDAVLSEVQSVMKGIVKEQGTILMEDVKRTAPIDTGHLRASYGQLTPGLIVKPYPGGTPRGYSNPIWNIMVKTKQVVFEVGTRIFYGPTVELRPSNGAWQAKAVIRNMGKFAQVAKDRMHEFFTRNFK